MLLDGLASSHPISQEVFEAADIDRVFDWIAYKKANIFISCILTQKSNSLELMFEADGLFAPQKMKALKNKLSSALLNLNSAIIIALI